MRGDQLLIDYPGDERCKRRPIACRAERIEPALGQVRNARREREAEEIRQCEDVIADAAAVGMVRCDAEVRLMIEQAVDHVRGLSGWWDRDRLERRLASCEMRVEQH